MDRMPLALISGWRPFPAAFRSVLLSCFSCFSCLSFLCAFLALSAPSVSALQFPDTADLKKDYKVSARKDGRPVDFYRIRNGDSSTVRLEWSGSTLVSARLEQESEYEAEGFSDLTAAYGNGAAWHESMTAPDARTLKLYPGLQQQWHLKGFGGEKGWLGSGLDKSRFFLVFRAAPPTAPAVAAGPLRLNGGVFSVLDTSSQWLHVPCKDKPGSPKPAPADKPNKGGKTGPASKAPFCFSPAEDSRLFLRIDRKKPLALQAWLDEGESAALSDIKKALQTIPDAAQADYAKDLSHMLAGEAQAFLVKFSQRLPEAFTWPSWQIQDLQAGKVQPAEFLPLIRRQANAGDSLPAFRYEDAGLRLSVNLYYRGMVHLIAEERLP
jgi:hypothetical protein